MSSVLLIEPNQLLGEVYCRAFEQAGYRVDWQQGAQSAIMSADENQPDIVILELQLPGHSGIEFLYEFRSYPDWQKIPVILHTLMPDQLTQLQKQQLNIAAYLYKPSTNLSQLSRTVRNVVLTLA